MTWHSRRRRRRRDATRAYWSRFPPKSASDAQCFFGSLEDWILIYIYIYQYNSINNKYSRHLWIFCIMDFFGFFWILFFILPAVPNMALCPGDCLCDNTRLVVNCTNVYLPDMPITLNPHIKVSYLLELKSDLQILFRRYCWRYLSEKNLRLENSDQY